MRTKRKAIGTTLGVLIFIGILFSSIIPLQVFMKEQRNHIVLAERTIKVEDDYREYEDLYVLAYPVNTTASELIVQVENKGPIPLTLKNLWVKDEVNEVNVELPVGGNATLGPYTVPLLENITYPVKIVTERGRIFSSDSTGLIYRDGTWIVPTFGISIQIANEKGKYYILVSNSTWSTSYQTLGQDEDDVLVFFALKTTGKYSVICKKNDPTGPDLPGTPMMVEIKYPNGSPVVFIYTSGYDV